MTDIKIPLYTKRLILREFTEYDTKAITKITQIPDFRYIILDPKDPETASKFIKECMDSAKKDDPITKKRQHYRLAIEHKNKKLLIGYIELFNIDFKNLDAEIGYFIHPEFQNKRYATEATSCIKNFTLDKLKLDSIYATTREDNNISKKVLKNLGMSKIDTIKNKYNDDVATRLVFRL